MKHINAELFLYFSTVQIVLKLQDYWTKKIISIVHIAVKNFPCRDQLRQVAGISSVTKRKNEYLTRLTGNRIGAYGDWLKADILGEIPRGQE